MVAQTHLAGTNMLPVLSLTSSLFNGSGRSGTSSRSTVVLLVVVVYIYSPPLLAESPVLPFRDPMRVFCGNPL